MWWHFPGHGFPPPHPPPSSPPRHFASPPPPPGGKDAPARPSLRARDVMVGRDGRRHDRRLVKVMASRSGFLCASLWEMGGDERCLPRGVCAVHGTSTSVHTHAHILYVYTQVYGHIYVKIKMQTNSQTDINRQAYRSCKMLSSVHVSNA